MASTAAVSEYRVTGMTCEHCVKAVTEEIMAIDGVSDVQLDLGAGRVAVVSDRPLDEALVRAAIDEAGYQVA